jgi:hypothetical protein
MKPVKKSLAKFLNGSCFVFADYKKRGRTKPSFLWDELQKLLLSGFVGLLVIARNVGTPWLGFDWTWCFPNHIELTVGFDFANEH